MPNRRQNRLLVGIGSGLLTGNGFRHNLANAGRAGNALQGQFGQEDARAQKLALLQSQSERQSEAHKQNMLLNQEKMGQMQANDEQQAGFNADSANMSVLDAARKNGLLTPQLAQALAPKAAKPVAVGANSHLVDPTTGKAIFSAPQRNDPNKPFNPDGTPNLAYQQYQTQQRIAGRNNVNVGFNNVDTVKNSRDARNDYQKAERTQNYNKTRRAFSRLGASLGRESGIGDTAAIVEINKMLDPNSVVREAEFAIAMNSSGKLDKMRNYGNQLLKGHKLSRKQREEYFALASEFMQGVESEQQRFNSETRGIAGSFGMNEQRIAPDLPKIDYTSPFGSSEASGEATQAKPAGMPEKDWTRLQELRKKYNR